MASLAEILEQKRADASIENNSKNLTNNSIELPAEIEELVTGDEYWRKAKINRYKMLIREGHLNDLLELAKMAREQATKAHPSHWFAKWASKKEWGRTLETLAKLRQAARVVAEVAERIAAPVKHIKAVYAAYWRFNGAIMQQAVTAQETGRDSFKYFCWLTRKEHGTVKA